MARYAVSVAFCARHLLPAHHRNNYKVTNARRSALQRAEASRALAALCDMADGAAVMRAGNRAHGMLTSLWWHSAQRDNVLRIER